MGEPFDETVPERTEQLVLTVGMVWRESRVSCPHRDILRAYRDGALEEGPAGYLRWHIDRAQCPFCQAQLDDFAREDSEAVGEQLDGLRDRLLSSTMSILREKRAGDK